MTHTITGSESYHCGTAGTVDLSPRTWTEVKEWFVKWDTLHILFKGNSEWEEFEIDSQTNDIIDWKRPINVDIYEGQDQFDNELASSD